MSKIEPTFNPYSNWEDNDLDYALDKKPLTKAIEDLWTTPELASDQQVGGNHYTKLSIQPMTYSMSNNLNALQHTAIKYVTRYQDKGTALQDLAKARHCIDMMVEDWIDNHE